MERRVYLGELVHLCSADDLRAAIERDCERHATDSAARAKKARDAVNEATDLLAE